MNIATQATPRSDDESIEQEIRRKGKTAARVTPADIEAKVLQEVYFTAYDGVRANLPFDPNPAFRLTDPEMLFAPELKLLTFCVLVLFNGFTVTGESACASPENFDAEIGRKIARQNAVAKIWPLEGYLLKQRLHKGA